MSIYTEKGYADRTTYLESLAEEYDVDDDVVFSLAEALGPSEDFDGLLEMLKEVI